MVAGDGIAGGCAISPSLIARPFHERTHSGDVTYPTLWKLQTGRPQRIGFDVIEKLCLYLECSPGDLLSVIPGKVEKETARKRAKKQVSAFGKKRTQG